MPPYFLYLVGFQLLILVHTSQSSETAPEKADIKKLARKLISETLADQLAEEVIKSEKPVKHPKHHHFIKDKNYENYDKSIEDINQNAHKKVMHHRKEKPYRTTKNFLKETAIFLEESLQKRQFIGSLEVPLKKFKDSNEISDEGISVQEDTKLNDKQMQHKLKHKYTKLNEKPIADDNHHHLHKYQHELTKLSDKRSDDKQNLQEHADLNDKQTPHDRQHPYNDPQKHTKLNDKQMHEKKQQHLYKHQQKRTQLTEKQMAEAKLHHLYKHKQLRTKLNGKQIAESKHHHVCKNQQLHTKLKHKQMIDDNQQKHQQKNAKMNDKQISGHMQQYHPYNQRNDYKKFQKSDRFLGLQNKTKVVHRLFLTTRNSKANSTILPKVTSIFNKLHNDTSASARRTPTYPRYEVGHGQIVSSSISQEFIDKESKSDEAIAKSLNTFKTQLDEIVSKIGATSKSNVSTSTAKTTKPVQGTRSTAPSSTTQSDLFTKF